RLRVRCSVASGSYVLSPLLLLLICLFFFFNDTATSEIYTLSLHVALPICVFGIGADAAQWCIRQVLANVVDDRLQRAFVPQVLGDRKSTRLNSSHDQSSYAVFCLKKKRKCVRLDLLILVNTNIEAELVIRM